MKKGNDLDYLQYFSEKKYPKESSKIAHNITRLKEMFCMKIYLKQTVKKVENRWLQISDANIVKYILNMEQKYSEYLITCICTYIFNVY